MSAWVRVFAFKDKCGDEILPESDQPTPFADLVRDALASGEGVTYRRLAERAIDPETGHQVQHSTIWKIAKGEAVKITPAVVRAIAAAIDRPARQVQLAAAHEYIGLVADDPFEASTSNVTVVVAHTPGMTSADMPKIKDVLKRWASGEDLGQE